MPATPAEPQPLPRSLVPLPDETLPGFILRLSHRLDQSPGQLMRLAGLTNSANPSNAAPVRHLVMLQPAPLETFARLTRLTPEEAQALTLRRFSGRDPAVTELLQRPGGNQHSRMTVPPWLLLNSSRYCPRCLAGDGTDVQDRHGGPWKLQWRLATVFACLEHGILLEHLCPACHHPPFGNHGREKRRLLVSAIGEAGLHPAQCRNGVLAERGAQTCGGRLDTATARPLRPELASLQTKILDVLESGTEPTAAASISDLQITAAIVAGTWPLSAVHAPFDLPPALDALLDRRNAIRADVRWDAPPRDADLTAALLSAADALLVQPRAIFWQNLNRILPAAVPQSSGHWGQTWTRLREQCSPTFRLDVEHSAANRIPKPPRKRQPKPFADPPLPVGQHGFLPEHIPQRLPTSWMRILFDHGAQESWQDSVNMRFRRTAAVDLIRAATGVSFPEAARFLGISASRVHRHDSWLSTTTRHYPRRRDHQQALTEAFAVLAQHIARTTEEPANYHHRRLQLTLWHLPTDEWHTILTQLPPVDGDHSTDPGRDVHLGASAHIWATITGSEWGLAPCFEPPLTKNPTLTIPGWPQHAVLERLHNPAGSRFWGILRKILDEYTQRLTQKIDASIA
ncbi:TniQ family protein [Kitasatospora sp. NPDC085464]|uniref:TniQ family protein n=1 Tax=Kitasatospora sp. NPDC085464 TaxID=3364063 RepID=UPI0037C4F6F3